MDDATFWENSDRARSCKPSPPADSDYCGHVFRLKAASIPLLCVS